MPAISMRINRLEVGDDHPVRVMGVLNVSPESFYRESVSGRAEVASRALSMLEAGADMLDLGGRSTAPRSAPITLEQEMQRVSRALEALLDGCDPGETPISVDTQYRPVAQRAREILRRAGRERLFVLNDVSCLTADPDLAGWAADAGCPVILMASRERPGDSLGIAQTLHDLERGVEKLTRLGVHAPSRVVVDPAIGKWTAHKTAEHDCEVLRELEQLRSLGLPILVGVSRKSFIGQILGRPDPAGRLAGTQAATAVAVAHGAHIVRTHDVTTETLDTVRVAWWIRNSRPKQQSG